MPITIAAYMCAYGNGFNMNDKNETPTTAPEGAAPGKDLSPEARRALDEAADRRKATAEKEARARELGGPKGEEPTRYGDWERGGRAVDF